MRKYLLVLLCFLSASVFADSYDVTITGSSYCSRPGDSVRWSCNIGDYGYGDDIDNRLDYWVFVSGSSSTGNFSVVQYDAGVYGFGGTFLARDCASEGNVTFTVTFRRYRCPDRPDCEKWKCPACNKDFCSKHQQHFAEGGTIASNCVKDHLVCADTQAEALSKWNAYKQQNYVFCSDCKTYYCVLCPHKCDGECDLECTKKNCPVCGITYCPTHDGEPIITTCPDCDQQKCNHQTHTCPDPDPDPDPDPPSDYTDILDALNGINDKLNEQNKMIEEIKEDVSDILDSLTKTGTYSTPDGLEEETLGKLPDNTESDKPFGIGDGQGLTDGLKDVGGLGNIDSFSPSSGGDWIITFPLSLVGFGLEDVTFNVTQNLTDLYSPLRSVFSVIVWLWGTYMGYGILRDGLTLAG